MKHWKMKKTNIILLGVLVAVLGYVLYHNYFSASNLSVTVAITNERFSKDKITVLKGTTVTWVNEGARPRWPASNPHPKHTLYPEGGGCIGSMLDACRGLLTGESFSFQFNDLGEWGMHDHLLPGNTMVVEVVDKLSDKQEEAFDKEKAVSVLEFRALDYAKQTEIIKSMAESDPAKAWAYSKESFMIDGQVVGNAHEFAHIIGNSAFKKFGLDGVKICDQTFAFGCFHGVTEMMLLTEGLKNVKAIEEGCLRIFPPETSQDYTGCIHGMGHGVYSFEGGNLKKALLDCDIISEPYRQYCYDGVFMENSTTPSGRIFDEKAPWKFCTDLDERYQRNCARYQAQVFLSSENFEEVGKNCALGPSVLLRETCFQSLGFYVAQNSLGKPGDVLERCKQMPSTEGMEICATGGAIESIFQRYTDFETSAKEICESLTEPRRGMCLTSISQMLNRN